MGAVQTKPSPRMARNCSVVALADGVEMMSFLAVPPPLIALIWRSSLGSTMAPARTLDWSVTRSVCARETRWLVVTSLNSEAVTMPSTTRLIRSSMSVKPR